MFFVSRGPMFCCSRDLFVFLPLSPTIDSYHGRRAALRAEEGTAWIYFISRRRQFFLYNHFLCAAAVGAFQCLLEIF